METSFFSAVILLFLVIDPLGLLPICIPLLSKVPSHRRPWIIIREVAIAFLLLLFFMFFGHNILELLRLNDVSLAIAGGLLLLLIAVRMIFPHPEGMFGTSNGEPFIVPLAIPLLAGPSALATVLLLVSREPEALWTWVGALTLTMVICAVIVIFAERLSKTLGEAVLTAIERLMGLILMAIAVQMILEGIEKFVHSL